MARATPLQKAARNLRGPAASNNKAPKAALVVASDLRRRILSGAIPIGSSLTESELIEEFAISRPTLREALRILEMEQLLEALQGSHRGSTVRMPDTSVTVRSLTTMLHLRSATLLDIYDARLIFEPPAARMAAERATDADVERLRVTLEEELKAVEAGQILYPTIGWRLHTEMVALSGNQTLAVMTAAFEHISEHHATKVVEGWSPERCAKLIRQAERSHRRLVDLIAKRDGPGAEDHWRRHMEVARTLLFDAGDQSIIDILD